MNNLTVINIALVFLQIPSLRPFVKYGGEIGLIAWVVVVLAGLWALRQVYLGNWKWAVSALHKPWIGAVLLVCAAIAITILYPIADALKEIGQGSDQDDCTIRIASNLLAGVALYKEATAYTGNICSDGPGIPILLAPLVAIGAYHYASVLGLLCVAVILRIRDGNWYASNLFLLLFFSSLISWELMVVGSDFVFIGCCFYAAFLCLSLPSKRRFDRIALFGAAISGFIISARLAFFYWPILLGFALWPLSKWRAVMAGLVAGMVGLALFVGFGFYHGAGYAPLHLTDMAIEIFDRSGIGMFAIINLVGLILLLKGRRLGPAISPHYFLAIGIAGPMFGLAMVRLMNVAEWSVPEWSAANYVLISMPAVAGLVVACLLNKQCENAITKS